MKSLIAKMDQLSETETVNEAEKGKLPPWLKKDKEDGKEIAKEKATDRAKDVEAEMKKGSKDDIDEAKKGLPPWLKKDGDKKAEKADDKDDDKEKVDEALSVQADGEEAMSLLNLLKLSGQTPLDQGDASGPIGHPMDSPMSEPPMDSMDSMDSADDMGMDSGMDSDSSMDSEDSGMAVIAMQDEERDPSYANTPNEKVSDASVSTPSGNDMHRTKGSWRASAGADNPMVDAMEGKLAKMFESLSKDLNSGAPKKKSEINESMQRYRTVRPLQPGDKRSTKIVVDKKTGFNIKVVNWPYKETNQLVTDKFIKFEDAMKYSKKFAALAKSYIKDGYKPMEWQHFPPDGILLDEFTSSSKPKSKSTLPPEKRIMKAWKKIYSMGDEAMDNIISHGGVYAKYAPKYEYDVGKMIKALSGNPKLLARLAKEMEEVADDSYGLA